MSANLRQLSASCPLTVREFVNRSVPRSGTHAMTTYIFLLCLARFLAHSVPETLCEHVTSPQWPTDAGTEPRVPRNPFCYTGTFPWIQGRRNRTQESFGSALPSDHSPSDHSPCRLLLLRSPPACAADPLALFFPFDRSKQVCLTLDRSSIDPESIPNRSHIDPLIRELSANCQLIFASCLLIVRYQPASLSMPAVR